MHSTDLCFTPFEQSIADYQLPERFTFPFYYQPHPLCLLAVQELQHYLTTQKHWQHNFGLTGQYSTAIGKMFGILVVQNKQGKLGYLSAFSGKLAEQNNLPKFVPPVFDMLTVDGFYFRQQAEINELTVQIEKLAASSPITALETSLRGEIEAEKQALADHRTLMANGRSSRKIQRAAAELSLNPAELLECKLRLSQASIKEKNILRDLKCYWAERIQQKQQELNQLLEALSELKNQRKALSATLQQQLFAQYRFLNQYGGEKNLYDIFKLHPQATPPAGAGECAAPKLLHYAFKWDLKPIALAEFWWGAAPKSEIRQHGNFYPACQGKCQPILAHMLAGIAMDENPMLKNPAIGKNLEIIYQDEVMLVINKPEEFLSVPGKTIEDSVYLRMKTSFPKATGPLIVHRLDMSTSGLMVIALTKKAHKNLQKQFIQRSVNKRYVALLAGNLVTEQGSIHLPLRVDLDDRPRQMVCHQHGKSAETTWQVIERSEHHTKVYLYPKTGRTHQLRVHCAHVLGLNMPIMGDDLYGTRANRLHLHAESLSFTHPETRVMMHFNVAADF